MRQEIFRAPQYRSAIDILLIYFLSILNKYHALSGISTVDFDQVNAAWESSVFLKTYIINK